MTDEKIRANFYVVTPSYGSVIATDDVHGLLDRTRPLRVTDSVCRRTSTASIGSSRAPATPRSTMVVGFLADICFTHLMWIDGDIGFKGDHVVQLLKADRPVPAGVYPLKPDGWPRSGLSEPQAAGASRADFQARFATYPAVARAGKLEPDADSFLDVLYAPTRSAL